MLFATLRSTKCIGNKSAFLRGEENSSRAVLYRPISDHSKAGISALRFHTLLSSKRLFANASSPLAIEGIRAHSKLSWAPWRAICKTRSLTKLAVCSGRNMRKMRSKITLRMPYPPLRRDDPVAHAAVFSLICIISSTLIEAYRDFSDNSLFRCSRLSEYPPKPTLTALFDEFLINSI